MKIDEKFILKKKCQNNFFFQAKSFFLNQHQQLHILAKSDVSRLNFKKNIPKRIFSKKSLKKRQNSEIRIGKKI